MMVNVSRFNAVQQHIEDEIRALCKELSNSIELNANDLSLTMKTLNHLKLFRVLQTDSLVFKGRIF